jgi:hypothetical protein
MRDFQVPVIAVFTKYEQFRREIMMKLEDQQGDTALLDTEVEKIFQEQYLANLKGSPRFVRLESEGFVHQLACIALISILQKCTSLVNGVLPLLKRLPVHSLEALLPSCSWLFRKIIWSST